jgi:DNA-binding IclR family transcriptional regulator
MSKGKYYFSKSLEKGLKILELFNSQTPAMTQSAIARTLGLNMTSTYRYINTLVELGYLEKDAKTREIRPSVLCMLFCNNLMRATDQLRMIREAVDRVHRENNISIDVAFAVNDSMARLYRREAEETLTFSLPDFPKNCLHNTALGKAWLSSLPGEMLTEKIDGMELVARTERTIVDKKTLIRELRRTKARGYALSEQEYLAGLISIGAPVIDPISDKGVGAVAFDFSVLQHSAEEVAEKFGGLVKETAKDLSALVPPHTDRGGRG